MKNPIEIFSDRVQNYLAYRPGYKPAILDVLREEYSFTIDDVIADMGSGTGLLSELFLKNGNIVFGIEPNAEMRTAGEQRLKAFSRFVSVNGRAEATTLGQDSIDFVTVGQAFHWFNQAQTKQEFARILKPTGWVVAVYNMVRTDAPFLLACEQFYATYLADKDAEAEEVDIYTPFFGKGNYAKREVSGVCQKLDLTGLIGRVLSRANTPQEKSPLYEKMLNALETIFDEYQQDGKVEMSYATEVVCGQLPKP
jgi:ubiquinone/menaquinone biosynthesis C-methylase UbiE